MIKMYQHTKNKASHWSFFRMTILNDRPKAKVILVEEICGFTSKSTIFKSEFADINFESAELLQGPFVGKLKDTCTG